MHKLKELIDNGLEELPMRLEKAGILSNNIHDVAGHHSLVVFSSLHLGKTKQIFDNCYQKSLLCLLIHGQRDRTDGPAEDVAVVPRPLSAIHLSLQLLGHDLFRVDNIQMGQVYETLANRLV